MNIGGFLFLDLKVDQGDLLACPTNFRLASSYNLIKAIS